jgi:hypothetical protein
VGGRQTSTGTVARYDASGNLDRTFGSGGKVTAPFGTYATTILEQADGKLVVGSFANDATVLRITRVDSSGAVDPTYGTGGHFEETLSFPQLVALQQDDRVLLGGSVVDVGGKPGVLLFRHDATGQREGSADGGGAPITQLDKVDELYVAPGGQVYVIGTSHGFIAIARLRPSLELDPDFGVAGVVLGPAAEDTQSFLVEPDGKMVVVGVSTTFWLVARLWP